MDTKMKLYALWTLSYLAILLQGLGALAQNCGRQAGGAVCANGQCCSQFGWCGNTPDHCGTNCQSQCGGSSGPNCGRQAGGAVCANGLCCNQFGYCGNTPEHCGTNCQSQCGGLGGTPPTTSGGVERIITQQLFDQMLKYRNDARCPGNGFYTYDAFIAAARTFNGFGTTGDTATRKRELAAFLGQTSHETTGGWPTAPDGPYAWGYCFIRERNQATYCTPGAWPCAPGRQYYGRGPIQLTHNYNYGPAGNATGNDLINNPDLVATDPSISFKTAIWFWMTPHGNKPSCHDVITGQWTPSRSERDAGLLPGYGLITRIITNGLECGHDPHSRRASRIGFYKRYCNMLGVSYGNNLDC